MITKEERQEVAERLRHLTPSKHVHPDYKPRYTDICTAIGGKKGYCLGISALAERLADLIDPTCTACEQDWRVICSMCGRALPDGNYCPHCGARVVNNSEKS